jgi:hypothetical protein
LFFSVLSSCNLDRQDSLEHEYSNKELLKAADSFIQSIRDKRNELLSSNLSDAPGIDSNSASVVFEKEPISKNKNEEKTVAFNDQTRFGSEQISEIQSEEESDKSEDSVKEYDLNSVESSQSHSNEDTKSKKTAIEQTKVPVKEQTTTETNELIEADENALNLYEKFKRNSAVLPSVNEDLFKIEISPNEKTSGIENVHKLPRVSSKNNFTNKHESKTFFSLADNENGVKNKKEKSKNSKLLRFFEKK